MRQEASIKRRNVGVPKFLKRLYEILQVEDPAIISWTFDGTGFIIHDTCRMELDVLPRYYKHCKITSFQRQLNYFGFRKWTRTQTFVPTFSHPCFLRGNPSLLNCIKRKGSHATVGLSTAVRAASEVTADLGFIVDHPSVSIEPLKEPMTEPFAQEDLDMLQSYLCDTDIHAAQKGWITFDDIVFPYLI